MEKITGDEAAFARAKTIDGNQAQRGLTIRQYYAGLAMQGMLANRELVDILQKHMPNPNKQGEFLAMAAVEQADCLISELNKPVDTKP